MARLARGLLALTATVVLLEACHTAPPRPSPPGAPWAERRSELQSLAGFHLDGRVAVAAADQGFSAHIDWQQHGAGSVVQLNGPLGVGAMRVVASAGQLAVTNSSGQQLDQSAAREELHNRLGFDPPLGSLRYWVLGVPDPATPSNETLGADQRLAQLEQDGWSIQYGAYMAGGTDGLPQRLSLTRGSVRVKLLVSRWQLPGAPERAPTAPERAGGAP